MVSVPPFWAVRLMSFKVTIRYLDENEVAQQRKAAPKGGKKK